MGLFQDVVLLWAVLDARARRYFWRSVTWLFPVGSVVRVVPVTDAATDLASALRGARQLARRHDLAGRHVTWRPASDSGDQYTVYYRSGAACSFPPYSPAPLPHIAADGLCFGTPARQRPQPRIVSAVSKRDGRDITAKVRALSGPRGNFYRDADALAAGARAVLPAQTNMGPAAVRYSDGTVIDL